MIVIVCSMWSDVTLWIGLAYPQARLVFGSGVVVDASLGRTHQVVDGLMVLVVMIGFCWKVHATFLQRRCRGGSPGVF